MSSLEPKFSRRARVDLRRIVGYSRAMWGSDQAERYRTMLDDALTRIGAFPEIGTPFPELAPNARRLVVAQHTIAYLERDDGVYIVRVVHQRMSLDDVDLT